MLRIKSAFPNVLIVLALTLLAADKPKLVKMKVAEGITISIPQDWRPMDAMDFTQRYPSVRAPLAAYTNDDRTVDFSVNISATQWPDTNIELAREFFKASLMNTFDRVDMIQEGVQEINKKKFAYFEFESRMNGNRREEGFQDPILRYTYIQYLVEPGKTLVFSFNCPRRVKDQWQETARAMMKAIKVK
ncbi:MAG TPA: hypothetical protein VIN08_20755 [Ohtaekwangia sp.]|uniref:hypothetical protein n=1 Tax=Ohtaekwangia sp. TaxID=2066019 RepID=UPI002F92EE94